MDNFFEEGLHDNETCAFPEANSEAARPYSSPGDISMGASAQNRPVPSADHSMNVTPVRPRLPLSRYPPNPYYTHPPNYMYPDVPTPRSTATENLLASVVDSQKKVLAMVEGVSSRIGELEKVVTSMKAKMSESTSETGRIPSHLSKAVATIHEALAETAQFRPQLGSKDEHNVKVKRAVAEEIFSDKENSYSKTLIDKSIQRYFESRKRSWRETTNPEQQERVTQQNKRRRIRSRKQRLYDRRYKMTHDGEEREKFEKLSLDYMSEESSSDDEEGEGSMTVHKPVWRSTTLNKFLEELDKRVVTSQVGTKKHIPKRKDRVPGRSIESSPPVNYQRWAVSKDWQKDHPDCAAAEEI